MALAEEKNKDVHKYKRDRICLCTDLCDRFRPWSRRHYEWEIVQWTLRPRNESMRDGERIQKGEEDWEDGGRIVSGIEEFDTGNESGKDSEKRSQTRRHYGRTERRPG